MYQLLSKTIKKDFYFLQNCNYMKSLYITFQGLAHDWLADN